MREALIHKTVADWRVPPNLDAATRAAFSWDAMRAELGAPADDFNIARLAVDRHAASTHATRVALRCLATDAETTELSYADLRGLTNRFAKGCARSVLCPPSACS